MSDYNGWKNKETWLVNLWLGDIFSSMQEEGEEITPAMIEELVEDCCNRPAYDGFVTDLLNCALGSIDYYELAAHYKED